MAVGRWIRRVIRQRPNLRGTDNLRMFWALSYSPLKRKCEGAMLSDLGLRRFKKFNDVTTVLDGTTILVGANNGGKSTLLQAVHLATSLCQAWPSLRQHRTAPTFSVAAAQMVYSPTDELKQLFLHGDYSAGREFEIELGFRSGDRLTIGVKNGRNKNIAVRLSNTSAAEALADPAEPYSIYVPGLAGIPKREQMVPRGVLTRSIARGDSNLYLRNVLYLISKSELLAAEFAERLSRIFPSTTVDVHFDPNVDEWIDVTLRRGGSALQLEVAGTGLLQAIQIISYITLFKPQVTLLDEPDSHLHPNNQKALMRLIEAFDDEQMQFIIATHSRHVLSARTRGSVVWTAGESLRVIDERDYADVLVSMGALGDAEEFLLNNWDVLILTEDADMDMLERIIEVNSEEGVKVRIWSYEGCTNIQRAEAVAGFLQSIAATPPRVVIHRDRDALLPGDISKLEDRYRLRGVELFVTAGTDIESYFVNPRHIESVCGVLGRVVFHDVVDRNIGMLRDAAESAQLVLNKTVRSDYDLSTLGGDDRKIWAATQGRDDHLWMHGKKLLGLIRDDLQARQGRNLDLLVTSPHLRDPRLASLLSTRP